MSTKFQIRICSLWLNQFHNQFHNQYLSQLLNLKLSQFRSQSLNLQLSQFRSQLPNRFRNQHPAFAGTFQALPAERGVHLVWTSGEQRAELQTELSTGATVLRWTAADGDHETRDLVGAPPVV